MVGYSHKLASEFAMPEIREDVAQELIIKAESLAGQSEQYIKQSLRNRAIDLTYQESTHRKLLDKARASLAAERKRRYDPSPLEQAEFNELYDMFEHSLTEAERRAIEVVVDPSHETLAQSAKAMGVSRITLSRVLDLVRVKCEVIFGRA